MDFCLDFFDGLSLSTDRQSREFYFNRRKSPLFVLAPSRHSFSALVPALRGG